MYHVKDLKEKQLKKICNVRFNKITDECEGPCDSSWLNCVTETGACG